MKTTIDIADSLFRQAKRLAAKQDTTLKELIESAWHVAALNSLKELGQLEMHAVTTALLNPL